MSNKKTALNTAIASAALLLLVALPSLASAANAPLVLSLDDAIYLALRNNVNLQSQELNRILDKYSLVVAKNAFEPKYTLGANGSLNFNKSDLSHSGYYDNAYLSASPTASVSVESHYGTQISVSNGGSFYSQSNGEDPQFSPSVNISVVQPLIKGFGRDIVDMSLKNALDSEEMSKLKFKDTLETTIKTIINDYLAVYQSIESLKIDQETLKNNKLTLENDKFLVAAGRKASSELTADQVAISQTELSIQKDQENIRTAKFTLLVTDLSLDPSAEVEIPQNIDFDKIILKLTGGKQPPDKETNRKLSLANDVNYITSIITYNGATQRALVQAKNDALWDLTLNASESVGATPSTGSSDVASRATVNTNTSVSLNLDIPVDSVSVKQGILSAQIALQQGKLALEQQKKQVESDADDRLFLLQSSKETLRMSIDGLAIEGQNVDNLRFKNRAGLSTNYDLLNEQKTLTSQQQQVVSNKIDYINKLIDLNYHTGTMLDCWGIKIRY